MYGPPTRTATDVARMAKRAFGDESGVQLEEADIIMWINSAQNEIVKRNRILKATSTTVSVVGQKDYTFPSLSIIQIESLHYDGTRLENMQFAEAENFIINGGTVAQNSGEPTLWYEWGGTISLYPIPQTVKNITLYYTKTPDPITTIGSLLTVPDKYFEDIVRFVLQQAYEMDEDWSASQAKQEQFNTSLEGMSEEERASQNMTYSVITTYDT